MSLYKTGERLRSQVSAVNVVVVRVDDSVSELTCGGVRLARTDEETSADQVLTEGPSIELGKRYEDEAGLVELLCVTAGVGELAANGSPLSIKTAKPLPASD
ncbi:hypothetical protein [Rhodococcus ruber]|uniref:hypothetical protein n=1 Tax=Rhodococcus ruber TaxID=1830 RepID=UPI00034D1819|nr:hypothetical protein [Rhodococcus ruber]